MSANYDYDLWLMDRSHPLRGRKVMVPVEFTAEAIRESALPSYARKWVTGVTWSEGFLDYGASVLLEEDEWGFWQFKVIFEHPVGAAPLPGVTRV